MRGTCLWNYFEIGPLAWEEMSFKGFCFVLFVFFFFCCFFFFLLFFCCCFFFFFFFCFFFVFFLFFCFLFSLWQPFCFAERNHLGNFGKGAWDEHFCEIILKSGHWPGKRCRLNFFSIFSSVDTFFLVERNHSGNFGKGAWEKHFYKSCYPRCKFWSWSRVSSLGHGVPVCGFHTRPWLCIQHTLWSWQRKLKDLENDGYSTVWFEPKKRLLFLFVLCIDAKLAYQVLLTIRGRLITPFILGPCLLVWSFWFVIRLRIYEFVLWLTIMEISFPLGSLGPL